MIDKDRLTRLLFADMIGDDILFDTELALGLQEAMNNEEDDLYGSSTNDYINQNQLTASEMLERDLGNGDFESYDDYDDTYESNNYDVDEMFDDYHDNYLEDDYENSSNDNYFKNDYHDNYDNDLDNEFHDDYIDDYGNDYDIDDYSDSDDFGGGDDFNW